MQEQLISFKVAKLAKEKGFQELVSNCYYKEELFGTYAMMDENDSAFIDVMDGNELENHNSLDFIDYKYRFSAPTQSLLQKWLREKYNQHIYLFPLDNGKWGFENNSISINLDHIFINYMYEGKEYNSYEEALEVGLQEALNFINSDLFIDNEG